MILKSFWHMTSTEILTRLAFAAGVAIMGSVGVYFSSPVESVAGISLFILIYRLRYKHFLPA